MNGTEPKVKHCANWATRFALSPSLRSQAASFGLAFVGHLLEKSFINVSPPSEVESSEVAQRAPRNNQARKRSLVVVRPANTPTEKRRRKSTQQPISFLLFSANSQLVEEERSEDFSLNFQVGQNKRTRTRKRKQTHNERRKADFVDVQLGVEFLLFCFFS